LDQIVLSWFVRIVLAVAGVIAGLFVAREAQNFALIEMSIALLLITILVAVAAFGPTILAWFRNRTKPGNSVDS